MIWTLSYERKQKLILNFFFKFTNNTAFEKIIENTRKHRDINFVTTETRRNYLVSEKNYDTKKKTPPILINKPVYLGLSMLKTSKMVIMSFSMIM